MVKGGEEMKEIRLNEAGFLKEAKKILEDQIAASELRCRQNRERLEAVNHMLEEFYGAESEETTPSQ